MFNAIAQHIAKNKYTIMKSKRLEANFNIIFFSSVVVSFNEKMSLIDM